jgi:predicted dehydrogenase
MRRRIGIWGATDESLRLMQLVAGNARVEVTRIFDRDLRSARERARGLGHALAHHVEPLLTDDVAAFFAEPDFDAVVDASGDLASGRPASLPTSLQRPSTRSSSPST